MAEVYRFRGLAYGMEGNLDKTIEDCTYAIKLQT